jgi:hypothetical protein
VTVSDTSNLDDLELELRKLPGVRAAGFTEREDLLVVQVQVAGTPPSPSLSQQAARIAYRHADKPIALEVVRWRTVEVPAAPAPAEVAAAPPAPPAVVDAGPPADADPEVAPRGARVRLLAVLTFPDTDELEVHLTYEGRRVIGRAAASTGVSGAVAATLEGLHNFAADLAADLLWAEELAGHEAAHASVVACALQADGHAVLGIAAGGSRIEAAARSALHALNRTLDAHLHRAT